MKNANALLQLLRFGTVLLLLLLDVPLTRSRC
jgi:hypothetical protein